jgi:hypothetical protein
MCCFLLSLTAPWTQTYLRIFNAFVNHLTDQDITTISSRCRTSKRSMREIESFLGDQVISKDFCLTRSPDLTMPDVILWGLQKGKCLHEQASHYWGPQKIHQKIAAISANVLHVFTNMGHHIQFCMDVRGNHFHSVPYMMGCNFTRTEVCTCIIWSSLVHK